MPWIPDVTTNQTIYSTQWGNLIRDRVHHLFATVAEMKTTAAPVPGMVAYVTGTASEYRWDGTGWAIIDEPWQDHTATMRIVAGNAAWRVGASGAGPSNLRLSPQSQSRYRRRYREVELLTNVVFQDGYPVGQPTATLVMELPILCDNGSMPNLNAGSAAVLVHSEGGVFHNGAGYAQGNNVWSTGGPAAHQDGATDFPVPADVWSVALSYPTTIQYA